jgi:hypothetical protein
MAGNAPRSQLGTVQGELKKRTQMWRALMGGDNLKQRTQFWVGRIVMSVARHERSFLIDCRRSTVLGRTRFSLKMLILREKIYFQVLNWSDKGGNIDVVGADLITLPGRFESVTALPHPALNFRVKRDLRA